MGFPSRISRSALGPKLRNRHKVRDESYEIASPRFELAWWQTAGLSNVCDLAWAHVLSNATLAASGEAWDSESLYVPSIGHPSTGTYTLTYAATYPDETETLIVPDFRAAFVTPQGSTDRHAHAAVAGLVVTVYMRSAAGALVDGDFVVGIR
jgi:hypothetical protein